MYYVAMACWHAGIMHASTPPLSNTQKDEEIITNPLRLVNILDVPLFAVW